MMHISTTSPLIHPIIVPAENVLKSYNFYLVENEGALFLVDAGEDSNTCWEYLLQNLKQVGAEISDVTAIILTHSHIDHIGLVNRIREIHDIPVYVHKNAFLRLKRDETFLKQRISFFENLYQKMGCGEKVNEQLVRLEKAMINNASQKITGEFTAIEEEDELFGFQVIEVFGHAPDHIALYHKERKILLAGDLILGHSSSNPLIELDTNGKRTRSLEMYESSLEKVFDLPINIIYPGHGEIIHHVDEVISQKLHRINKKGERVLKHLKNKRMTADQLAKIIYKEKYDTLFPLVMSEVIGHLDRLETLQKVEKEKINGVYYYFNMEVSL